MAKVTWLGDDDPAAVSVTQNGFTFVKGEAVDVPSDKMAKFEGNPAFSTKASDKPVDATEPSPADPEAGTEKAALKDEIERLSGERPKGNPSVDTLRASLAKLNAKHNAEAAKAEEA